MAKTSKKKYLNVPNHVLIYLETIDELIIKIRDYLIESENYKNYKHEYCCFVSINFMFFYIKYNDELFYLRYIKGLLLCINDLIQLKFIIPSDEYKIEQDKFDFEFNKFRKKFYTEIVKSDDIFFKKVE